MTLKSKRILISAVVMLTASCDKNASPAFLDPATYGRENSGILKSGIMRVNELPPEQTPGPDTLV